MGTSDYYTDLKLFNEAEMGYVAGIAAAHAEQAYYFDGYSLNYFGIQSVLVVTDQPKLVTKRYMNGFKNGVLTACPSCNVHRILGYNTETALNNFQGTYFVLYGVINTFSLIFLFYSNGRKPKNVIQLHILNR